MARCTSKGTFRVSRTAAARACVITCLARAACNGCTPPLAALPLPPASSSVEVSNTRALVALELMSASLQEMSRLEDWNRKERVPEGPGRTEAA